jgi:SAM-dependent methyltransferase
LRRTLHNVRMRRLVLVARLLAESLRSRGLRGTLARLLRLVRWSAAERRRARRDRTFDESVGVETASWVRVPDLVTASPNLEFAVRYQPSSVDEFHQVMAKLDVDHRDFAFVDYGSGKGRVLILAAEYPFKRIVGVEFSPALDGIARQNLAALGPDAERVETVVIDAVDFDPPEDPLVLYFFNPFAPAVLEGVLERVNASLDRHPRPAYAVVIAPPEFADTIEAGGFSPLDVDRLGWQTRGLFAPIEGSQRSPDRPIV